MYIYIYEHDITKITLVSSKLIKLIYIALRVALEKKKHFWCVKINFDPSDLLLKSAWLIDII